LSAEHVSSGPCPGCGGMNPARYARMRGRVKCSWVGCPFAFRHIGRHAPGSRKPTWEESLNVLGASMGARLAVDAHFGALSLSIWKRLADSVPVVAR
jgi:hypothetical protein